MATKTPRSKSVTKKTAKPSANTTRTKGGKSEGSESDASALVGGFLKPDKRRGSAKKVAPTKIPSEAGRRAPTSKPKPTAAETVAPATVEEPAEPTDEATGLTWKESRFVVHYLCTGNATESARQAGYEGSSQVLATTGWRLLRKAEVLREVQRRTENDTEELMLSRKMFLRHLAAIADGSVSMEQAMPSGEGIATVFAQTPPRERLKALELMGKMRGFFVDKVLTSNSLTDLIDSIPEDA